MLLNHSLNVRSSERLADQRISDFELVERIDGERFKVQIWMVWWLQADAFVFEECARWLRGSVEKVRGRPVVTDGGITRLMG